MYRVSPFVRHFAWALSGGAILATLCVNLAPERYYDAVEWRLADLTLPLWLASAPISLTLQSVVADVAMSLFIAFIAKELWEALVLERGALAGRQAIMPLAMTLGAMAGAAVFWLALSGWLQTAEEVAPGMGWYIPGASDVVLCYVVGRRVFGAGHPALHILLLITIASDIAALLVHGVFRPDADLRPAWLLLPAVAAATAWALYGRKPGPEATERDRRRLMVLWPYVVAGVLSWIGVAAAGLPPALGLLPVVPAVAHAARTFGIFAEAEHFLHDPLNRLSQALVWPVVAVLFAFGLTHGGIDARAFGPTTLIVLGAAWIGKPLGLLAATIFTALMLGQRLPAGMTIRELGALSLIMATGFAMPSLMLDPGLPGGQVREAARLGLALSLLTGPVALALAGRLVRPKGRLPE